MDGGDRQRLGLDSVQLRATKDGNSEVVVLSRGAAEVRRAELEAEGWRVEISDAGDGVSGSPRARSG